jgi:hypothetical protein
MRVRGSASINGAPGMIRTCDPLTRSLDYVVPVGFEKLPWVLIGSPSQAYPSAQFPGEMIRFPELAHNRHTGRT